METRDCLMVGVSGPSHGFVEFSCQIRPLPYGAIWMPAQKNALHRNLSHAICRKFGGRTFLRQYLLWLM